MLCRLHQPWQSRRVRLPGPWGAQSGLTVARGRRDWLWRRSRAAAAGRGVGTAPVNCAGALSVRAARGRSAPGVAQARFTVSAGGRGQSF